MKWDAAKKARFEQRAVLGLLVVFLVVLAGSLKNVGLLRGRRAPAPQTVAFIQHVDVSKTLPETFKEHWQRMEPQQEVATQTLRPASAALSAPLYNAHDLRDPLESLLPEVPKAPVEEAAANAHQPLHVERPMPSLRVEGLWWETQQPRAIINGEVYGIGDQVSGATIRAIGRDGVTLEFDGRFVQVEMATGKSGGVGSQTSQWR